MPRAKKQPQEIVVPPKRGRGRPTLFTPQILKRAWRGGLAGFTDVEMCELLDIGLNTFYTWQKQYPEFREAIRRGKLPADMNVASSLYREAQKGNVTAQIFWLKNRRRNEWRDVQSREISGPNGGPIQAITGTVVVDVASLGIKQREQFKAMLLKAKAKETQGEADGY